VLDCVGLGRKVSRLCLIDKENAGQQASHTCYRRYQILFATVTSTSFIRHVMFPSPTKVELIECPVGNRWRAICFMCGILVVFEWRTISAHRESAILTFCRPLLGYLEQRTHKTGAVGLDNYLML